MVDFTRRTLLTAAAATAGPAAAQAWLPPTPAAADPEATKDWPSPERFPVWPGTAPGAPAVLPAPNWTLNGPAGRRELWVRGVPVPEVHVFRAARPDGSAVLSIPGGGYGFVSVQNEGLNVARRYTPQGTTVFVLTYRLPGEGWAERSLAPLRDAQRAVRLIRSRAANWSVDPARLGVLGFSAGGHLAADLATAGPEPLYPALDAADRLSARPAFAGLVYPVMDLSPEFAHGGSRANLLGPDAGEAQVAARSPLRRVGADTPPLFLLHAFDDGVVPVRNSLETIGRATAAKVPVEAVLLERGGHGFGFGLPPEHSGASWPDAFLRWAKARASREAA